MLYLFFDKDQRKILKDVQPDTDIFGTKNFIIYCILLICFTVQKVLLGLNPFMRENLTKIKEEAATKSGYVKKETNG